MVNWPLAKGTSTRTAAADEELSCSWNIVIWQLYRYLKGTAAVSDNGMQITIVTSKDISLEVSGLTKVILGADYYLAAEVLTLLLTYQLTHGSGNVCPPIGQNNPDELKKLNWKGGRLESIVIQMSKLTLVLILIRSSTSARRLL